MEVSSAHIKYCESSPAHLRFCSYRHLRFYEIPINKATLSYACNIVEINSQRIKLVLISLAGQFLLSLKKNLHIKYFEKKN